LQTIAPLSRNLRDSGTGACRFQPRRWAARAAALQSQLPIPRSFCLSVSERVAPSAVRTLAGSLPRVVSSWTRDY